MIKKTWIFYKFEISYNSDNLCSYIPTNIKEIDNSQQFKINRVIEMHIISLVKFMKEKKVRNYMQ